MINFGTVRLKDYKNNYIGISVDGDLAPLVVVDQPNQATANLIYDFQAIGWKDKDVNGVNTGVVALSCHIPGQGVCYVSDRPDHYGKLGLRARGGAWVTAPSLDEFYTLFYMQAGNRIALLNQGGYVTPLYDPPDPYASVLIDGNPVKAYALCNKSGNGNYTNLNVFGGELITQRGAQQTFWMETTGNSQTDQNTLNLGMFETLVDHPPQLIAKSFPNITIPNGFDLEGSDLSGFDLSQCMMKDVDLSVTKSASGLILTGATLNKVSFKGLQLDGVNFFNSHMNNCDFTSTQLGGSVGLAAASLLNADFTSASLGGISLANGYLIQSNFSSAEISGVDFSNADLSSSIIPKQNLQSVKLKGANLSSCQMQYCNLTDVDLTGASLEGTDLTGVDLTKCTLPAKRPFSPFPHKPTNLTEATISLSQLGNDWSNTVLVNTKIVGLDGESKPQLDGLLAQNSTLQQINFTGASLKEAKFDSSSLTRVLFDQAKLYKASFSDASPTMLICQCTNVSFSFADLSGADFSRAKMETCQFVAATLSETKMVNAILGGQEHKAACDLSYAAIENAHLNGINLFNATLANATIRGASTSLNGNTFLGQTDLSHAFMIEIDLSGAKLNGAILDGACLLQTKLSGADFSPSEKGSKPSSLSGAYLQGASFSAETNFDGADLSNAIFDFSKGTVPIQYCEDGEIVPPRPLAYGYDATPSSAQLTEKSVSGQTTCPNGLTFEANQTEGLTWNKMLELGQTPKTWRPLACRPSGNMAETELQIDELDKAEKS